MARLRGRMLVTQRVRQFAHLTLLIGGSEYPEDVLRAVWELDRDTLLGHYRHIPGMRPWAYWWFDLGEERPSSLPPEHHAEAVRLAELGLLTRNELAALEERANVARARIGTRSERTSGGNPGVSVDARAVELWEAVRATQRAVVHS